jgi:predicted ATPase
VPTLRNISLPLLGGLLIIRKLTAERGSCSVIALRQTIRTLGADLDTKAHNPGYAATIARRLEEAGVVMRAINGNLVYLNSPENELFIQEQLQILTSVNRLAS